MSREITTFQKMVPFPTHLHSQLPDDAVGKKGKRKPTNRVLCSAWSRKVPKDV